MKTFVYKIITLLCASVSIIVMSPITLAQKDCNTYWAKCHVDEVHTIHTEDEDTNARLLDTIKNAINRCLWILATLVLCFCMYWWFKMLTSWGDSKSYDAWRTILKNAAIGLAIIWLSWLIVSAVIRFVNLQWWGWTMV